MRVARRKRERHEGSLKLDVGDEAEDAGAVDEVAVGAAEAEEETPIDMTPLHIGTTELIVPIL